MPTPKKAATPKNALSKPVQPDAALAAVVGKDPLPRTELTKRLWEYIRKHELQDPKDKRSIRADEKLLAVFDGKKIVSMFEITKLVNGHLCEAGRLMMFWMAYGSASGGLVRQRVSLHAWVAIRPPTEFGLTGRKLR